ncbi:M24 family metallopeptidase [bacterium]|nr:M24 family metallopeptidase [bacterium]
MRELLKELKIDYLLVNSTNEFLVEYSELSENARYTLTGFSGSTGDALVTPDKIYLFVDGRYHTQAEKEAKKGVEVVKLQLGQKQDEEIKKLINPRKTLGIVAKKISQARLESFNGYKIKLLDYDPINNHTESHLAPIVEAFSPKEYKPEKTTFISNLEEVAYLTGYRDFSKDYSSKIWAKMVINGDLILFTDNKACEEYLSNFTGELIVDKNSINAYDYSLIKNPIHKPSEIKALKSIKSEEEIEAYKQAFDATDKALMAVRDYIESEDNISEADIECRLRYEFKKQGAKNLSFKPIIAINENSALAHYSKNSKDVKLQDGDLVLIDCGAYFESGLATDITRVFAKGEPLNLHKKVYTMVLKAFLNCFNSNLSVGYDIDKIAHQILDESVEGFNFSHGLGHGIGINVHEAPPALNQSEVAKTKIKDGMCFTIEPGLYNSEFFGVRLENSCYMKDGKIHSFVKMGYEDKLIKYEMLTEQEKEWLKEFKIL